MRTSTQSSSKCLVSSHLRPDGNRESVLFCSEKSLLAEEVPLFHRKALFRAMPRLTYVSWSGTWLVSSHALDHRTYPDATPR